jgi:hypothetical protein
MAQNSVDDMYLLGEDAKLYEEVASRSLTRADGQRVAPVLQLWDASVGGIGKTSRFTVTLHLSFDAYVVTRRYREDRKIDRSVIYVMISRVNV